jgi:L-alanine-DL-glutamate epimerase-like enolase superfamily enzyme
MKVTDVRIDVVRREVQETHPLDPMSSFSGTTEQGLLRVLTDEGIEGNCLVGNFRGGGQQYFEPVLKVMKPLLVGRDPAEREWLWDRVSGAGRGGVSAPAWAPVDVALWDIAGKAAGMPVHKLLGTQRYETEVYATYPPRHTTPEGYVGEAEELAGQGFRAYKIHPGLMGTRDVVEMAGLVRKTVGSDVRLMLDPNSGYRFRQAYEIGRALDDNGFHWFEDPVPHTDFDAIAELSRRLRVPLCMSDGQEQQFFDAAHMIRLQALRLVRGSSRNMGITGLKKLCSMAEGFGMNCEIGTPGNSLLNAANLHVIFSVANCDYFEFWMPQAAHQFGLVEDIKLNERMTIDAPTAPGLGYEVDWGYIESHKVATME